MSSDFSDQDKKDMQDAFGKAFSDAFIPIIEALQKEQQANKILAESRHQTILSKLDTILSKLEVSN